MKDVPSGLQKVCIHRIGCISSFRFYGVCVPCILPFVKTIVHGELLDAYSNIPSKCLSLSVGHGLNGPRTFTALAAKEASAIFSWGISVV